MKILCAFIVFFTISGVTMAQDVQQLQESAKTYMKQGDYRNAILVLNKGLELQPGDLQMTKDVALSYYFQNENKKALETILPVVESQITDDQVFQIAGMVYRNMRQNEDAEKMYRRGLKKYPESGALYNDLGEVLASAQDADAIKEWQKGIQEDPGYSRNYYNAAKYHAQSSNKIWSILYAEIFLNMEPHSSKAAEIKDLLFYNYKTVFSELPLKGSKESRFENDFLEVLAKQSTVAADEITPDALLMLRTRFILEWFDEKRPSFKLFEYHRQLLQEGLFEAYNQWLFGATYNLSGFQNWINAHPEEYTAFTSFQKTRVFKMPAGEYYQK